MFGECFRNHPCINNDPHQLVVVDISRAIYDTEISFVTSAGVLGFSHVHRSFINSIRALQPDGDGKLRPCDLLYSKDLPHLQLCPAPDCQLLPAYDLLSLSLRNHVCDVIVDVEGIARATDGVYPEVNHLIPLDESEVPRRVADLAPCAQDLGQNVARLKKIEI